MGAEQDALYGRDVVHATARAYQTTEEMIPHVGHDLMLDDHWVEGARRMEQWLGDRNL